LKKIQNDWGNSNYSVVFGQILICLNLHRAIFWQQKREQFLKNCSRNMVKICFAGVQTTF